jgi:cardiolipin synthase
VHHFENGVWMYRCDAIRHLKADIDETLKKSAEVTPDQLKTGLFNRFIREVFRLFAPML